MKQNAAQNKIADFIQLTKPTITLMVLISTTMGYYLAVKTSGVIWVTSTYLYLLLGSALVCGGTASLNEYWERHTDKLMRRTVNRPLPSGRITARAGLIFGVSISLLGLVVLSSIHPVTTALAALTLATYIFIYTPLKKFTTWNTVIGAFPGALPPLGGWVAAGAPLELGAWVLFAIMFSWQIPHFLAIATIYQEDYERGGYKMIPSYDASGVNTGIHVIGFTIILIVSSLVISSMGVTGWTYLIGAVGAGLYMLRYGIIVSMSRTNQNARGLLMASIIYLPLLLTLLIIDIELLQ